MIGRVFLGRYEARRLLGEGGMGKVYLARQLDLAREVVVKVMHEHIAADTKFRDRFQRETLLMARFQHPGAVTLYDASLDDPLGPCIVMEYVKGVNLENLLAKNGRMSAPRVGRIIGELCEALQAAHDEGIIHRDLKPANLMIVEPDTPRERIKVMDFGLAKLVERDTATRKVTDTNVDFAVGTPGYICPEQVRGEEMDHRGDLYGVGVMMYELLTGRLPFTGPTSMDILLAHATEYAPTFSELGLKGMVPREVEAADRARAGRAVRHGPEPRAGARGGARLAAGVAARGRAGFGVPARGAGRAGATGRAAGVARRGRAPVSHGSVDARADRDCEVARVRSRRRRRSGGKRAGANQGAVGRAKDADRRPALVARPAARVQPHRPRTAPAPLGPDQGRQADDSRVVPPVAPGAADGSQLASAVYAGVHRAARVFDGHRAGRGVNPRSGFVARSNRLQPVSQTPKRQPEELRSEREIPMRRAHRGCVAFRFGAWETG
jgi:tRNA A-37 threonylcarbamoyl transferase component Bud32